MKKIAIYIKENERAIKCKEHILSLLDKYGDFKRSSIITFEVSK